MPLYVPPVSAGLLDAKGDLIAASGQDQPDRVPIGTDGQVLKADSGQSVGVKWTGGLVSALPGSPADGDMIFFQNSGMATDGIAWQLRYNAASASSYKWEFVGGPLWSAPQIGDSTSDETRTSSTFGDLATVGPSRTAPLAGDYNISYSTEIRNSTGSGNGAWMSFAVGATAATDADAVYSYVGGTTFAAATVRKTGIAASSAITAKYKADLGTAQFNSRRLAIEPIRLG